MGIHYSFQQHQDQMWQQQNERMEASIRRMEGHFEIIVEAMQSMVHEESLSHMEKKNATTIPSNGENIKTEVVHDFFNDLPCVSREEIEKEEIEDVAKEVEDVSFEASLLYEESMPYVPPIACPCCLHKSNWYRLFSKPSKPLFQVHIYLPLLVVIRNIQMRTKYFQDLISRRRIFEALKFG